MRLGMLETSVYPQRVEVVQTSTLNEECREEELAVLPQHTRVIVTGNNRTRSLLLGLQGVVKKAVGFGGWHWLVLTNGDEVKLQRNALSVIEAPSCDSQVYQSYSSEDSDFGSRKSCKRTLAVNLRKLGMASLGRYYRHFKLEEGNSNPSKEELIEAVKRHFASQQLDEFQVIAEFLHAAKRLKQSAHGLPDWNKS